jgi:hypothetical protein
LNLGIKTICHHDGSRGIRFWVLVVDLRVAKHFPEIEIPGRIGGEVEP